MFSSDMAAIYVITDPCFDVKDRSCMEVCPVDCIETTDDDRVCYIDPDRCTGCNLCLPACPVGAIFIDGGRPGAPSAWTAVNALWFRDRDAARAEVNELL